MSNKSKITQKELKKILKYNPETGIFKWKISRQGTKKNKIAGYININGYRCIMINGKFYNASRLAFLYMEGYLPEYIIDHKDGVRDNNKWGNLRHVSHICNLRNMKIPCDNNSGIVGVCWSKHAKKWRAQIGIFKKSKNLGYFVNFIDAVKARWEAEKKYGWQGCNTTSSAYNYLQKFSS